MELFTATGKLTKFFFFWQLEMFDTCTAGDTAHIDTIFKFLPHMRQHGCVDNLHCKNLNIISMYAVSPVVHLSNISSCQKNFFSLPVAVNNTIKVGRLVFLL
jgi:hypothetical protein